MIKAIDVSYCQTDVAYRAVKQDGIGAVMARNGYLGKKDVEFDKHVRNALAAGLDVGSYTYILSETTDSAIREALQTVKRLEPYKGSINYPVFADIEDNKYLTSRFNKKIRTDILLAFLETINKEGYYPAVYINPSWLECYVDKTKIQGRYDIWLAAWTENPNKPTRYDYGQTMWQWGTGKVNGIQGKVDCDIVYCDYPRKIRGLRKNFLPQYKTVTLAYRAAIRSGPSQSARKLGVLEAGTKCVFVDKTDTKDPATGNIYVQLAGGKNQWIVKSAIQ